MTRSRNAPAGDIAEFLVRLAYNGELAPPSEKSWDVRGSDERKIQVKCRLVVPGSIGTQQFSPFRSWDFDVCVFIMFDAFTYDVLRALEVPSAGVQAGRARPACRRHSRTSAHEGRLHRCPWAIDVTSRLQSVMEHLD